MPTPAGTATLLERHELTPTLARFRERHELTPTLARFRFTLDAGVPDFLPGQFLTLGQPGAPRASWRAYSIASPPHEKRWIELYVREAIEPVPDRLTTALFHLAPGQTLPHRWHRGRVHDRGDAPRRLLRDPIAALRLPAASRRRSPPHSPSSRSAAS